MSWAHQDRSIGIDMGHLPAGRLQARLERRVLAFDDDESTSQPSRIACQPSTPAATLA